MPPTRPPIHPDDPEGPPYRCPYCDGPDGEDSGWPTERQRNGHLAAHPGETKSRRLAVARADVATDTDPDRPPEDSAAYEARRRLAESLAAVPGLASLPIADDAIDTTKTVKVKLFDTRNELIAGAIGLLMGIAWGHYPELFMEPALALPAALIGFGGYFAFKTTAIPEWAAVALVKNVMQYYICVGFGWGAIRFIHEYVPVLLEAFGIEAVITLPLF